MSGVERLTPSAARTRQSWETLATPSPAASGSGAKGKALEDDMVAATEKILKVCKMMSAKSSWECRSMLSDSASTVTHSRRERVRRAL